MMSIADNIAWVEQKIAAACRNANRPRNSVRLMAVSKTHPAEAIRAAHAAGMDLFGENRVQEYADKRDELSTTGMLTAEPRARFHLIGPLQSNKAVRAVHLFDAVDTLDSLRLAERLDHAAEKAGKVLPVSIEIKLSLETTKHGLAPDTDELDILLEHLPDFHHLRVRGLMTVPPYAENPETVRPYFRQLRTLRESFARRWPHVSLEELSMGMSHDFPVAIEEGATTIRVGTAIFGARGPAA